MNAIVRRACIALTAVSIIGFGSAGAWHHYKLNKEKQNFKAILEDGRISMAGCSYETRCNLTAEFSKNAREIKQSMDVMAIHKEKKRIFYIIAVATPLLLWAVAFIGTWISTGSIKGKKL